jgi:hypothetical protein
VQSLGKQAFRDARGRGVNLARTIAGIEHPFEGCVTAIINKALNDEPPAPSTLAVTAPAALDDLVRGAMTRRRKYRFVAATFAEATNAARDRSVVAPEIGATLVTAPVPPSIPAAASRSRAAVILAALLALFIVPAAGRWFTRPVPQSTTALAPHMAVVTAAATRDHAQPVPLTQQPVPAVATAATAAETAPPPPAQAELAAIGLGSLRREIEAALADSDCTLVNAARQDSGILIVSGIAGQQANQSFLMKLASIAQTYPLAWQVQPFDQIFCRVTATRPISPLAGAPDEELRLNS